MTVIPFRRPGTPGATQEAQGPATQPGGRAGADRQVEGFPLLSGKSGNFFDDLAAAFTEEGVDNFIFVTLLPMEAHLSSLQGVVPQRLVEARKVELRTLSDDVLKQIGSGSTKLEWSARPAYWTAFVQVVNERELT